MIYDATDSQPLSGDNDEGLPSAQRLAMQACRRICRLAGGGYWESCRVDTAYRDMGMGANLRFRVWPDGTVHVHHNH